MRMPSPFWGNLLWSQKHRFPSAVRFDTFRCGNNQANEENDRRLPVLRPLRGDGLLFEHGQPGYNLWSSLSMNVDEVDDIQYLGECMVCTACLIAVMLD
jgi:hypothetical protein